MSEAMTEQTAVDATNAPAVPGATAGQDARTEGDDLDTLLNQFDNSTSRPAPTPQPSPEPKAGTGDLSEYLALHQKVVSLERHVTAEKDTADFVKAAQEIRGDADASLFSNAMIRAWISDRPPAQVEKIDQIWKDRDRDPTAFKRLVSTMKREFERGPLAKIKSQPDKLATDDREAVTAAVRGASSKAPESKAPDFSSMNNAEFREAHKKAYGYYPSV